MAPPFAEALGSGSEVIAGSALKAGSSKYEGFSTDPVIDILLAVQEAELFVKDSFKTRLNDLDFALKAKAVEAGYDAKDLPSGIAELGKHIRDRMEALLIRGITVEFSRTSFSRYVAFTNANAKVKSKSQPAT